MGKYDSYKDDLIIKDVTEQDKWYSISTTESTCFGLKKKYGIKPQVGDTITLYSYGGMSIRGMDLNGKKIFYTSDAELEQHRKDEAERMQKEKEVKLKANKAKMDKQYENLPEVFKSRIDRFRRNNPTFRVDYEDYELFCCEEAVKIAEACKTPEGVQEFQKMEWVQQKRKVQLSDGHSGNTFGCAVHLAYWYLQQPENVTKTHGSLSPLVGSEAFGDIDAE